MNPRNGCCYKAIARIGRDPSLTLRAVDGREPESSCTGAQAFIRERFAARYGARVRHFMPTLLQLEDDAGQLYGVVGVRSAADDTLFLERYLDRPVETEIARLSHFRPARDRIVEVGNLAARGAGHARLLIVALADLLVAHGFDWVVFTGTAEVLNSVRRLHLSPLSLGDADPRRIGDEVADWGSYYATHPKLMAGDLRTAHARLTSKGVYHRLGHQRILQDNESHDAAVA